MKKSIFIILLLYSTILCFSSCSFENKPKDLSDTVSITVTCMVSRNGMITDESIDVEITDTETVDYICSFFSSLTLRKSETGKPLFASHQIYFKNADGETISSIILLAGLKQIQWGDLHTITSDHDLHALKERLNALAGIEEVW